MLAFEGILLMLTTAVALLALSRRIGVPYPTLLALAGAGLAFAPIRLPIELDPSLILALFVAPVLLDSAYDTSVRDLKRVWLPVVGLVLVAVGLSTAAVAFVVHMMVPALPWPAAVALGAIVAPPDAAAAIAVLRQLSLPRRLTIVLEGESLLNDASALLIYRVAVSATLAGGFDAREIAPAFLVSVLGSLVAGPVIAVLWRRIVNMLHDAPSSIIVQFVGTYGIWLLAERFGLSPILTVVSYAITISQTSGALIPARMRIPSYAVWETAVVMLNVLAFMLIGLELGPVIAAAPPGELMRWTMIGGAALLALIGVRLAWVGTFVACVRLLLRTAGRETLPGVGRPNWRNAAIVGWCGMRGIVTVASALALPFGFPERGLLLFVAFAVTLGTLLVQGATLKPLVMALRLRDDGSVDREVREARVAMAEAALEALSVEESATVLAMREEFAIERQTAVDAEDGDGRPRLPSKVMRAEILAARRGRLIALRSSGAIGDDAFHRLEEELDYADLATATRL